MKKGLDAVIEAGGENGRPLPREMAAALRERLREVLGEVDDAVVDDTGAKIYQQARRTWGGDRQVGEALERGREFLKMDPRLVAREMADMSDAERDMFRFGALDALGVRMGSTSDSANLYTQVSGNRVARERIQELFPDPAEIQRFADDMGWEKRMAGVETGTLGGAVTARIQAEQADLIDVPMDVVGQAVQMNAPGVLSALTARAIRDRVSTGGRNISDALAPKLAAGAVNPDEFADTVRQLLTARASMRAGNARGAQGTAAATSTATSAVTAPAAPLTQAEWDNLAEDARRLGLDPVTTIGPRP